MAISWIFPRLQTQLNRNRIIMYNNISYIPIFEHVVVQHKAKPKEGAGVFFQ